MQPTNPNYTKTEEKLCYILSTLRNTGVIIETEEGMRYLKGEEFDETFGITDTDRAQMDSVLLRNNPYTDHLIAANILKKGFNSGTNP